MQDLIPEFAALKSRYPAGFESSLVMPCLRRIQEKRGYVANEDIDGLAAYLGVPRIQIEEALSFYTEFRRAPVGRVHIAACRNVSCSLRGAERIVEHLARRLGIRPGETTKDGRFSFATVECLASCGTAPVVTVNGTYHEDMTPERIDALLSELRQ
jgi:NADH-quinone oxidoreductase subunit E